MISATVGRIAQLHKRALLGRYSMPDTEKALALTEAVILGWLENPATRALADQSSGRGRPVDPTNLGKRILVAATPMAHSRITIAIKKQLFRTRSGRCN